MRGRQFTNVLVRETMGVWLYRQRILEQIKVRKWIWFGELVKFESSITKSNKREVMKYSSMEMGR